MIAITKRVRRDKAEQENELFLRFVPAITYIARSAFRTLRPQEREEAVCEVVAYGLVAFRRLAQRGKLDAAFATALARFGVARFRAGRRVGNRPDLHDVFSVGAQRDGGFSVKSGGSNAWIDALADNTRTPVADAAAFRVDFPVWLRTLQRRDRKIANFLMLGNRPSETAEEFGISRARVAQLRSELKDSWEKFQAEEPETTPTGRALPRGQSVLVA